MRWIFLVWSLCACHRLFDLRTFEHVDAAEPRPDLPRDICGVVGAPCCTTGAACSDGSTCLAAGGRSRCVAFAGAYEINPEPTCGASPCLAADMFGGACACPTGFVATTTPIDTGCGPAIGTSNQTGTMDVCAIATMPPGTDWGGMYVTGDLPACEPGAIDGCLTPNAMTGACTCPATSENVAMRIFVPAMMNPSCTNDYIGGMLHACLERGVAQSSIAGVFELDADGYCEAHSDSLAGCECPAGTLASPLRSVAEQHATTPLVFVQTTITFCLVPP